MAFARALSASSERGRAPDRQAIGGVSNLSDGRHIGGETRAGVGRHPAWGGNARFPPAFGTGLSEAALA